MNETDFKALIQVALDIQGSKNEINQQIKQLQKSVEIETGIKVDKNTIQQAFKQISNSSKPKIEVDLDIKKDNLTSNLDSFLSKNTKLNSAKIQAKELQAEFEKLRSKIADAGDGKELSGLSKELSTLKNKAQIAGLTGVSFGDTLKQNLGAFSNWFAIGGVVAGSVRAIKDMVSTVSELDTQMTNIRMVTGGTAQATKELMITYNQMAKELGATTVEVSTSANEFLRQGKSIEETNTLIKNSMILSKIGMLSSSEATTYLTSAMKGYGVAANDTLSIVDKLSAVDMKSATSAGGLADAMSRTAKSAQLAGVSMDKLIGYLALVGEVTQKDMSSIGESFKTIFSRMGNVKLGNMIDEDGNDMTSQISDVEKVLSKVDIKLRTSATEFRNFGDVLDDVGKNWSSFTEVEQSAIATTFAGVRQRENFLVLMDDYGTALSYMETSINSSGTAMDKFNVRQESVEAKSKKLKASLEELATKTINSGLIKGFLDLSTVIVNLISAFGGLAPILTIVGGIFIGWKTNILPTLIGQIQMLILAQTGYTASTVSAALAQVGLAGAIKATTVAMWSFLTTTPVGWAILAAGSVFATVKAFDALTTSTEESQQAFSESQSKYESITNEIKSLEEQLKKTKERIEEIQSLDSIEPVQQKELDNLKLSNIELERQLFIKQQLAKQAEDEARKKAEEIFNTKSEKVTTKTEETITINSTDMKSVKYDTFDATPLEAMETYITEFEKLENQKNEKLIQLSKITDKNTNEYKQISEELDKIKTEQDGLNDKIAKNASVLDGAAKNLGETSEYAKRYFDATEKWQNLIQPDQTGTTLNTELEDATTKYEELSKTIETYSSKLSNLKSAQKEISESNSLTFDTIQKLIKDYPILEDALNDYLLGLKSTSDINNLLSEQYKVDELNYKKAIVGKKELSVGFYSDLIKNNADQVNKFNDLYGIDLKNCKTLAEAKLKVENELFTKIKNMWSQWYDVQSNMYTEEAMTAAGSGDPEFYKAYQQIKKAKKAREAMASLDNITYSGITVDDSLFGKSKDKSSTSSSNSKDTWKEAFQAEYNYIKYLRESDKLDAQGYYDKLNALNQKYFANRKKYLDEYRQYDLELYKLDQELAEDRIKDKEHTLTLKVNAQSSEATKGEQIRVYTEIQNELHRLAEEGRKRGLSENDEYMQKLSDQWWSAEEKKFNITKQFQDKQKSLYEGYISAAEKIHDLTLSMEKKKLEVQRDSHKEAIDAIKDEFDLKRSLLDDELDNYDYNKNLQEKVNNVNKIQSQIDLIKNDDTQKGRLAQLEDELTNAMKDLNDFQYRNSIDSQKKILDDQEKLWTDKHQVEIDAIDEKLNDEVYMRELADERIKKSGYNLYNELMKFSEDYGTVSKYEVNEIWKAYQTVLDNFNISQNGITSTLDTLYDKLASIKDLLEEMSSMSLGEFSSFQNNGVKDIISKMEKNSKDWFTSKDQNATAKLNDDLAKQLYDQYGLELEKRNGRWYDKATGKPLYHTGGVVGENDSKIKNINNLRNDEIELIAQKGELILSKDGTSNLFKNISGLTNIAEKLSNFTMPKFDNFALAGNVGGVKIENIYQITGNTSEELINNFKRIVDLGDAATIKKVSDLMKNNGGNRFNMKGRT